MSTFVTPGSEKKEALVVEEEHAQLGLRQNPSLELVEEKSRTLDAAALFLEEHRDLDVSDIDITKLRHRADFRVVPLMCACFILAFLDKAIYNYTALMGIKKDLHFNHTDFSNVATAYAIAHLLCQFPNTYFLQRFPAAKWLSGCVIAWGIVTVCTAFVKDVKGLYAARVFLAVFEATIGPSLMLITAQWYTKSEQAPRFAFWHSAPGVGQLLGALLSFSFQAVPKNYPIHGWRLMFIALGVVTLVVGVCCWIYLPDSPMTAKFLSDKEKVALLNHVSVNMTGVANRKIRPKELLECAKDIQVWMLFLGVSMAAMSHGLTGTYSTTLIKGMGFTGRQSALLNMPAGVVSIVTNLTVGFGIRHTSYRFAWAMAVAIPGIIGASLLSFLHQPNLPGSLAGLYMITSINSITTVCQQWAMSNVAGGTKRAMMAGVMSAGVGLSGILSPQTFQCSSIDEKKCTYLPAKITVMVTQAGSALVFFLLFLYYVYENKRRNKRAHMHGISEEISSDTTLTEVDAWGGMTDKQNWTKFRYVY